MTREEQSRLLHQVRAEHEGASTDWTLDGDQGLARLIPQLEPAPVLTFDPYADRRDIQFIMGAHRAIGFLLGMLDRAIAKIREQQAIIDPSQPAPKDHAQDCAIHCNKQAFHTFLHEVHGLDNPDSVKAANRVRGILNIGSRTELNENPEAAAGWIRLRGEFYGWMKR